MNAFKEVLDDIRGYAYDMPEDTWETCIKALRIADKLMQDPSEGMFEASGCLDCATRTWKAMRDQLLKECEG